jgi:AraC-like DNA-binding protein
MARSPSSGGPGTSASPRVADAQPAFEMVRRRPRPELGAVLLGISGYRELSAGIIRQHQAASLVVPIVISIGSPFRIGLGREPSDADRLPSFAAGLFAGPVHIASDGAAECVQVDFTPHGAFRVFGGAVTDLAARMVDIGDVLGREGRLLHERLAESPGWAERFDLVEAFLMRRLRHDPSREIGHAYRLIARAAGRVRMAELAREIGWSRKHLADRFRAEIGLGPKVVARIMRFENACRLARGAGPGEWALIAADAGYADQAHLVREFRALAGERPGSWARRTALADPRLIRRDEADG